MTWMNNQWHDDTSPYRHGVINPSKMQCVIQSAMLNVNNDKLQTTTNVKSKTEQIMQQQSTLTIETSITWASANYSMQARRKKENTE